MKAYLDPDGLAKWEERLREVYDEDRHFDTEDMHISDLTSCLRRPVLSSEYNAEFGTDTLWRFTLGRAFEQVVFQYLLDRCDCSCHHGVDCLRGESLSIPNSVDDMDIMPEFEVIEGGLQGHIDFAATPWDIETKCTWKRKPANDIEVQDFFNRAPYWVEQAGSYAVMRRRTQARFLVLHISTFPFAELGYYALEWTRDELADLWTMMQSRRKYVREKVQGGEYPMKTLETNLCSGCQVKWICDLVGD